MTIFFFKKLYIFINKSPISIVFYIFHCLKIIFNSFKKIISIKKYANEILDGPKKKNKKTKDIKSVDHGAKQKSIYVNLQKEYDEDKELLELLSGKRKLNLLIFIKKYSLY